MKDDATEFPQSKYLYEGPKPEITRALYEDRINSIHDTLSEQINRHFTEEAVDGIIAPAFGAFNMGDYERSLGYLTTAVTAFPSGEQALFPYLEICHRVIVTSTHADDKESQQKYQDWLSLALIKRWSKRIALKAYAKWLLPKWPLMMRCKYCGRYTHYVSPEESTAGLNKWSGGNYCDHCSRSYPMPSYAWDSIPGQAYIFYRRSVYEEIFYSEFLSRFDVKELNDDRFGGPLRLDGTK